MLRATYVIGGLTTVVYGFQWLMLGLFVGAVGGVGGSGQLFFPGLIAIVVGVIGLRSVRNAPDRARIGFGVAAMAAGYVYLLPVTGSGYGWPVIGYGVSALLANQVATRLRGSASGLETTSAPQ